MTRLFFWKARERWVLPSVQHSLWDSQRMVWTRSGCRRMRRAAPAAEGRPCGWRPAQSPLPCPAASIDTASGRVERSLRGVNHSHPNRSPLRSDRLGKRKAVLRRSVLKRIAAALLLPPCCVFILRVLHFTARSVLVSFVSFSCAQSQAGLWIQEFNEYRADSWQIAMNIERIAMNTE